MTATKGLEGIVATTSSISSIIDGVLTYRGINIDDLAENATFEEVVYLLWYGKLPNRSELSGLIQELNSNAAVPAEVLNQIKLYPKDVNTMAALRTAVSSLALYDPEAGDMTPESNLRKAIKLQAQLPTIVAAFDRIRKGLEPIAPKADAGSISENFLYMLTGKNPEKIAIEALDKALVLHADHELNASTFAARVTVATLSDIYSGVTSAIGALKGPLHGGANEAVMAMLEEIGTAANVKSYITEKLDNKQKIMASVTAFTKTAILARSTSKKNVPRARQADREHELVRHVHPNRRIGHRSKRIEAERRLLLRFRIHVSGNSARPVHADLRHQPYIGMDGAYP